MPEKAFSVCIKDSVFIDPACKSGVFLREITKRLIDGLQDTIPNLEDRINHILHNQVYGIAVTELTSLLSRRGVYCSKFPNSEFSVSTFDSVEGNIRYRICQHSWKNSRCALCGASQEQYDRPDDAENYAYEFIHTNHPERLFNKHFDVIVSNPPYHLSDGGGGSGKSATPIYQKFVLQALNLNPTYLAMLIPSRWFAGGKGLDEFRATMLSDKRIKLIFDYADSKDCFSSGVDIPGGICYFLLDNNHNGDCTITNMLKRGETVVATRPLNEYSTFIRQNRAVNIVKKVLAKTEKTMSDVVLSRRPFGLDSAITFDPNGDFVLRSSAGVGAINSSKVTAGFDIINKWKTIISKVTTEHAGVPDKDGRMRVLAVVEALAPGAVCTESYLVVDSFNTEAEANNLANYLRTKFVRFLMVQMLASMNMSKSTFSFVPVQDFSRNWEDNDLYVKYELTKEEIELIESSMKPMGSGV